MQNWNELVETLRRASSQQAAEFDPASQLLKGYESQPGFHLALLKIALSPQITEIPVRWIAVLFLKNGIDRHWRTHGPSPISNEEKVAIREIIYECFNEPIQQIALQFAVIISKISRFDYPRQWQDLLPYLANEMQQQNPDSDVIRDNTILLTFRLFMKELASKRLPNDKKLFGQVCRQMFPCVFKSWERLTNQFMSDLQNRGQNSKNTSFNGQKLINILKSFRSIVPMLEAANSQQFFSSIVSSLSQILQLSQHFSSFETFQKLLILHSKILLDILELELENVNEFIRQAFTISKQCVLKYSGQRDLFEERFIVNCMNQIKILASNPENVAQFISCEDMHELLRCLIFYYLPLTSDDLECWDEDVEDFCSEEIGEIWKYNLRPSAEVLFLTILHCDPDKVIPMIMSALQSVNDKIKQESAESCDVTTLMQNDAVFSAVGLSANELFDCLNFEAWFMDNLLPYVKGLQNHPQGKIIHRRVLWLIDQWMGVKPPNDIRTTLYDFIIGSLSPDFNMAVRLMAATSLRQILDDFEFELDTFLPFRDRCTDGLHRLLHDSESGDTRMRVLHVLSFVIERLGSQVTSCMQQLASILPPIWATSESHNMLRCAVVTTLVNLVVGLRGESTNLHPFLLPVIHTCTDISSPAHVYLLIDGLDLWVAVVRNSIVMTTDLMQLFNNLFGLFDLSSESLKESFHLVECYATLGRSDFVNSEQCCQFANSLLSIITDVNDNCLGVVTQLVYTVIGIAPIETAKVFNAYIRDTLQCFLSQEYNGMLSLYRMLLLARLALRHPVAFWQILNDHTGEQFNQAAAYLFNMFSTWIDNAAEITHRKEIALAVLTLLDNYNEIEAVRSSLPNIISVAVHVLHDVCDEDHADSVVVTGNNDINEADWSDLHVKRETSLTRLDPVHVISLPNFTKTKLEIVANFLGGAATLDQVLNSSVDQQVLSGLKEFI
uniref:Importin-11-like n=1 Tax=Ciona intestinalis TaxID=7719 RepID=F6UP98_CIOIN|nr:importin-11-like [Ciona intestinalis]|eukprot:XP_002125631.1 importin-11-like [Ciona intestinalis]